MYGTYLVRIVIVQYMYDAYLVRIVIVQYIPDEDDKCMVHIG